MALPAIINSLPAGYLDLLGLKTMGRNPTVPIDGVSPTLDMLHFYATAASELVAATPIVTAAIGSTGSTVQVPFNETWLVLSATMSCQAVAGVTSSSAQMTVSASSGAGVFQFYATPIIPCVPGTAWVAIQHLPFIMRPGDGLVGTVVTYAGVGNVTLQPQARICRLTI